MGHFSTDIVPIKMDKLLSRTNKTITIAALHNWNYYKTRPKRRENKWSAGISGSYGNLQFDKTNLGYHCSSSDGAQEWRMRKVSGGGCVSGVPGGEKYTASDCEHRCGIKGKTTFTYWYKPIDP